MKRRVIIVGPVPGPPGGVASVVQAILSSRVSDDYGLIVVDTAQKGRMRYSPDVPKLLSGCYFVSHALKLGHLLHTEEAEIVHVQACSTLSFLRDSLFIMVARIWRKRVVCHFHGMLSRQYALFRYRFLRCYFRWIMRHVDVLIVLSPRFASDFDRLIPATKKCVIPNFTPPFTLPHKRRPSEMRVLFVGRLSTKKGIYDLLEAAVALRDEPTIRFELAGLEETPADKDRILCHLKENNIQDNVRLAGYVQGPAKAQLFACSDILVLPSYAEVFPIVILEAMAAAMPVIATPVGAVPDMVSEGVNGFIVPQGDSDRLAERIRYLFDHTEERRKMGQNNLLKFNQEYRLQVSIPRISEIYRSLLRGEVRPAQRRRPGVCRRHVMENENAGSTM